MSLPDPSLSSMIATRKPLAVLMRLCAVIALAGIAFAPAHAQEPEAPTETDRAAERAAQLDRLFEQLAEPGREDWERIENEIVTLWSQSDSPAMDLLLRRGNTAFEAEEYDVALEHFSALTDHAPGFAEGWNARATTFYRLGRISLSVSDIRRVLALNPRHFGAIAGLGFMLEEMGETEAALEAFEAFRDLHPNRPNINHAILRLERQTGTAEL